MSNDDSQEYTRCETKTDISDNNSKGAFSHPQRGMFIILSSLNEPVTKLIFQLPC